LIHNKSSRKTWLSNIHLKAGLRSKEEERINQIKSTFKSLKVTKESKIPCIIIGDFNDDLQKTRKLKPLIENNGFICKSPSYTTCYIEHGRVNKFWKFDHVLLTPDVKIEYINIPKMRIVPDKDNPSDHFMINFLIQM
ncbi:unnamed protein product, partial [marine sediment metagenome]